jgi:D-serine deaminase-like pyridoxal phosphate-dependent protein
MIAAAGSAKYDTIAASDGVTDVIAGSYALNDNHLAQLRPELHMAARILATVISSKDDGLVWVDAGQKATSIDTGLPAVDGVSGVVFRE